MVTLRRFRVTVHSHRDAASRFALVEDGSTWPSWTPIGRCAREGLAGDGTEIVGTLRRFTTGIVTSVERVTAIEPGTSFTYALERGMPIANHVATVTVTPEAHGCRIDWDETFAPTIPGTGLLLVWFLRTFITRCAEGLAEAP